MNLDIINSILLLSFSIPIMMKYRLLPIEGTPYLLFGLIFLVLIIYLLITLYPLMFKQIFIKFSDEEIKRIEKKIINIIFFIILFVVLGGSIWTSMKDRNRVAPVYGVHDVLLQQETAMRFLLEGKNPYKETYFGTPMEEFHYSEMGKDAVNPALYHFVMPPWYLIFPFFIYFPAVHFLGFFDGRMVSLVSAIGVVLILFKWFKRKDYAVFSILLILLGPGMVDYLIEGRSDIHALFWFILSLYILDKKHIFLSSIVFALALLSKQTIWFATPFYLIYVWCLTKYSWKKIIVSFFTISFTTLVFILPFLIWDASAFIDSLIRFPAGNTSPSFPISGYGLGMVLISLGIIKDIHDNYPFFIWQCITGLICLISSFLIIKRKPSWSRFFVCYGITLFVIWYTSRYFNNSHLGYLSCIFIIGAGKFLDGS